MITDEEAIAFTVMKVDQFLTILESVNYDGVYDGRWWILWQDRLDNLQSY